MPESEEETPLWKDSDVRFCTAVFASLRLSKDFLCRDPEAASNYSVLGITHVNLFAVHFKRFSALLNLVVLTVSDGTADVVDVVYVNM